MLNKPVLGYRSNNSSTGHEKRMRRAFSSHRRFSSQVMARSENHVLNIFKILAAIKKKKSDGRDWQGWHRQ